MKKDDIISIEYKKEKLNDFFGLRLISLDLFPQTDSSIRKVLKPGLFKFSDEQIADSLPGKLIEVRMYGKNISVQSIVGMNGSGKSSLLDIIYRMINNFCYFLLENLKYTEAAYRLAFVDGLYADLKYEVEGKICVLKSRGRELALETPEIKYRVGHEIIEKDWEYYTDVTGARTIEVREVMKNFFYTIVTNFSFNAFLSSDYAGEKAIGLQGESWIDSLFHKNDGYRIPLVLNPYRGDGSLDVQRETNFAISRTIGILELFRERNWQYIDGYRLHSVDYHFDEHTFLSKFRKVLNETQRESLRKVAEKDGEAREREVLEDLIKGWFKDSLTDKKAYAYKICSHYGVTVDVNDEIQLMAGAYLVYKTLSIIGKYPVYYDYKRLGRLEYCFSNATFNVGKEEFEDALDPFVEIVQKLDEDKSHITYKSRLAKQYLQKCKSASLGNNVIEKGFELNEYLRFLGKDKMEGSVERIMEDFPPTFFKPMIMLKKVDKKGKDIPNAKPIPFTSLSSGEKLFIYTISTLIYHILNIKSVSSKRVHYRRVNIVMDELELCFHPEMQRAFVDKMVSTITRLHINTYMMVNLLLVTHSPFILSDIPKSRILFLREGKDVGGTLNLNPFGSNISDVLADSFFLNENGFLGDVSQRLINSLVNFLSSNDDAQYIWTDKRAEHFIDHIVGDEVIRHYLKQMLDYKLSNRKGNR